MNIIFNIQGGLGKSIMATAVAEAIKKNFPNSYLIVVSHFKDVFLNNPNINKVLHHNEQMGIWHNYIKDGETKFMVGDPYTTNEYINSNEHLLQTWCNMYGVKYKGEMPKLYFKKAEEQFFSTEYQSDKPIMAIQTNGGGVELQYNWSRDLPAPMMVKIIEKYKDNYNIFHIKRPDQMSYANTIPVTNPYRSVAFLIKQADKLLLIDSFAQHMAKAMNKKAVVCWMGTTPKVFGYDSHVNILANEPTRPVNVEHPNYQLYNLVEQPQHIPYNDLNEIFDLKSIYKALDKN